MTSSFLLPVMSHVYEIWFDGSIFLGNIVVEGEAGLKLLRETAAKTRMGSWKRAKKKQQQVEDLFKYGKTKQEREKVGAQGQPSDAQNSLQALGTSKKKVATKKKVSKKVATRK